MTGGKEECLIGIKMTEICTNHPIKEMMRRINPGIQPARGLDHRIGGVIGMRVWRKIGKGIVWRKIGKGATLRSWSPWQA